MKRFINILLVVIMIMSTCVVYGSAAVFDSSQSAVLTTAPTLQTFPDNIDGDKYLENLDPKNLYDAVFKGLYEQKFKLNDKTRTLKAYIPNSVTQGDRSVYLAVPSGVNTEEFLFKSGWLDIAEKYKFYLFAFEPENQKWNEQDGLAYITAAFNAVNGRPYYNIILGNFYFVGYGEGGKYLQQYCMANPKNVASMAIVDGSDISEDYMKTVGAQPSDKPGLPKSEVEAPAWIIEQNMNSKAQKVVDYWKKANHVEDKAYKTDYTTMYKQSLIKKESSISKENVGKVLVTKQKSDYTDKAFNERIWRDFLSKTFRFGTTVFNNALRPAISFDKLGIQYKELVVDGYTRHWYEYVPTSLRGKNTPAPLVVAMHGAGQTGAIMVGYSEWYKVAEDRGFIVVFPTGSQWAQKNSAPRPGWNAYMGTNPASKVMKSLVDNTYTENDGVDDVTFIKTMVDNVKSTYAIDNSRVYVTGQSMGSMMSQACALMLPDVFAAAGSTSFGMIGINEPNFKMPTAAKTDYEIPIYLIFGENDISTGFLSKNVNSAATIKYWLNRYNAGSIDKPLTYSFGKFNQKVWLNANGVPMVNYGLTQYRPHNYTTEENWILYDEFFSKFQRDADGNLLYMQQEDVRK